uniref:peptidylprolyl isomerase n=1 Tax=Mola mola TaxID=94237 RepID=A0A3Q4B3S1_MOLML
MFGGDDEDGDFLSPTGGAKLASLFELDQESTQGNESFQYTAPKQPRKSSLSAPASQKPAPPPGAPAMLIATTVQTFRFINGQYVKQGKLGAAVLGNHTTKEYKLLLYLSQQKQVTTAKIHVGFVFTVQLNNYCAFYDDQRQNWSVMFESEKASSDFCKEICLAKANSAASFKGVLVQDLSLGEGQAVENGDCLEVAYTGWLLQNYTIGQMFDSNLNKDKLLRLKVGAGRVIKGWEEGMLGMKKSGRRLIVVPPNLADGAKGVPANSTLIFEAELRRVKFSKDSGSDRVSASSRDSSAPSPAPSPATSMENLAPEPPPQTTTLGPVVPGELPLRAKSNSLSEQLANPDATKAKLISRMAKMGQPMLPFLTGVASQPESSDSELENVSCSSAAYPHPHTAPPSALVPVMTAVASQPGLPGSSHPFQPVIVLIIFFCPVSSDVASFLMNEARQHNTEIRLSIGKVADKVDQLASKLDYLQRQGSLFTGVSTMSMETTMVVHSIQRIVQENECLKKEVFEKSSRIEEQNCKIGELINQNQRYMEQSNLLLEKRNDSLKSSSEQSQARLLQAEQDKVRLTEDLALSTARLSQLQFEASAHQQKAMELQTKLSSVLQSNDSDNQRIACLETQLEEVKEAAEKSQAQYRSEKQRCKEMDQRVSNMEEELQDLKTDKESLTRTLMERKKKWQVERQRWDKEVEELRKSSQQELDNLWAQLRKARTSTDNSASEQMSQLQAELDEEWKGNCKQMLTTAKEQHSRELAELTEQKDALQEELTHLQEKFMLLKQSRDSEEQSLLQHCEQNEELQILKEKVRRITSCVYVQVKRVMNGVFHSLREQFDFDESYSGQAVLGVIVTTIKNVTLKLLTDSDRTSLRQSKNEEEEEENEKEGLKQETSHQNVHVNGEREVKQEHVAERDSQRVSETQMGKETDTVTESKIQSQELMGTDVHPENTELKLQEEAAAAADPELEQEQPEHSAPETSTEEKAPNRSTDPDDEPAESLLREDGQETVSETTAVSNEVGKESADDGENVGENNAAFLKAFRPPANPPPPPNVLQNSSGTPTR